MTDPIKRFDGEHRFLSNFYPSPLYVSHPASDVEIHFPTLEHAYQACKAVRAEDFEHVRSAPTPGQAKRRGRSIKVDPRWEDFKIGVMAMLLALKFAPGTLCAHWLLDTGDAELIEGNTWGDRFWGVCRGQGENRLGKLLMARREWLSQNMKGS